MCSSDLEADEVIRQAQGEQPDYVGIMRTLRTIDSLPGDER